MAASDRSFSTTAAAAVARLRAYFSGCGWLLPAILLLAISRLWLAPLVSSMWVDEMGTAFVVQHGAADPSLKVAPQVPASVYYALPRLTRHWFGDSEFGFRLPSLLAIAAALWLIFKIAQRLIHPSAGWIAVFSCLLIREFNYQAADARPYALGTFVVCAALYLLIRWMDEGRWPHAIGFGVCGVLLWRIHLLFWPFYLVFALYMAARLLRGNSKAAWRQIAAVCLPMSAALIPVAMEALQLSRQAAAHVVVALPQASDLAKALKIDFITPFCACMALAARWRGWQRVKETATWDSLTLVFAWWVVAPLALFGLSRLTGNSVFLPRYMCLALAGIALTSTLAALTFLPTRYRKGAAIGLGLGVLCFKGHWTQLVPPHHNSDWRGAAHAINREVTPETPVICPSPFIEARPPVWRPDYPTGTFLYSHLSIYPIHGKVYPFPYSTSPQAEAFAARASHDSFAATGKFVLYGGNTAIAFWQSWFSARPEFSGWRIRRIGSFGDVEAVAFEKPPVTVSRH